MNYLSAVNDLIDESKITLDPLTASNFASPPRTVMYNRMKKWVRESYEEIIDERPEWFFTQERAIVTIGPRLHLAGISGGWVPTAGDVLTGQTSGVVFTITNVYSDFESADNPTTEATVGVSYTDVPVAYDQLMLNELLDVFRSPATDFVGAAYVEGRGRYNFQELIPTLDAINQRSVAIQPTVRGATPNTNPNDSQHTCPVAYGYWYNNTYPTNDWNDALGRPSYIVQTEDGNYDFYARPDALYDVSFEYTQKCNTLALYNDLPFLLPDKFHKLIVWRAMIKLADFEANQKMYATAKKGADAYYNRLLRDRLPKSMFNLSRFDRGYDNSY